MRLIRYYFLVLILSCLPFIGIFLTSLLPHTHDGLVHLARIGAYFKALGDGQIPVRWAGDLNYGYGMPLFNFMYHVPYIISSFFIFLGAGLVSAFKITLVLSFLLSGIFMFGFSLEFIKDAKKAFLITLFYQFAPFHLVEVLIRGSFGEVYTYAFLPLALWGILLLFKKPKFKYILLTSVATALLVISHNAISFVFFLVIFSFVLFFGKKLRNYVLGFLSISLGLLLASFYWIPAILEHKYTYGDLFMKDVFLSHFPPFQNFFIPNFLNDVKFQTGGVSTQIGVFQTIAILVALFILIGHKKLEPFIKKILIFCLVLFLVAFFFMQPISKSIWENIALLRQFQFPWRLLSVFVFTTSLMSVSLFYFKFLNKKWIYSILIFLTVFSTSYYWRPQLGLDKINENDYWNFPLTTTYYGETDLIWSEGPAKEYPLQRIEVINGKGTIEEMTKKSNLLSFKVNNETPIKVVTHIQYFPGWRAFVDGKQVPIEFQYGIYRGHIVFEIPKGQHEIKLSFGESKLRFIADLLSVVAVVALFTYGLFLKFFKKS